MLLAISSTFKKYVFLNCCSEMIELHIQLEAAMLLACWNKAQ